eukprot:4919292-Pleurochrysis_carterae.AAC.1
MLVRRARPKRHGLTASQVEAIVEGYSACVMAYGQADILQMRPYIPALSRFQTDAVLPFASVTTYLTTVLPSVSLILLPP